MNGRPPARSAEPGATGHPGLVITRDLPGRPQARRERNDLIAARAALVALLILAMPGRSVAQEAREPPREFETLVVTGTRIGDAPARIASSTTVIDLATIEARQDASVLDLLRSVPGVQVTQNGGRGGVSSVFVRGGEPNFTVVIIDGVKVNDPTNTRGGSFDFSTLQLADIERIEIVRGPQSAIYGSDSLAGVIAIFTKAGSRELAVTATAETGRDDYLRGGLSIEGPVWGGGDFSLRAGYVDDGEPVQGSSFDSASVTGRLRLRPSDSLRFELNGRYADSSSESFPEDSGGPELAVLRETDRRDPEDLSLGARLEWELASRISLHLLGNYYDHEERFDSPGIAPGVREGVPANGSDTDLERSELGAYVVWNAGERWTLSLGADRWSEEGDVEGYVDFGVRVPTDFKLDRDIWGAYGEVRYETEALTLRGSLRGDDPDEFGTETTAKLGATYSLARTGTRLAANWGEGFKLPSFFALGNPLVGNPDLKPEKSESWDVGISQSAFGQGLELGLTYFETEYTDLIDFDFDLFTNVNRARVDTSGVELSLLARPGTNVELRAHLTYLDIDVRSDATELRQRPEWRGGAGLSWQPWVGWLIDLDWLYVDETFDSSVPTGGQTVSSYNRVDATLRWDATTRLRLILAVDNLLDEGYEEAIGFPAPDIRPRLGLRYRF